MGSQGSCRCSACATRPPGRRPRRPSTRFSARSASRRRRPAAPAKRRSRAAACAHMDSFLKAVVLRDVDGIPPDTLRAHRDDLRHRLRPRAADGRATFPRSGARSAAACDVIGAEILYAARHEMAIKLADALMRRTEAGAAGHPGGDAVERAAAIMARAHGWDEWRMRNEVAEVEAFYRTAARARLRHAAAQARDRTPQPRTDDSNRFSEGERTFHREKVRIYSNLPLQRCRWSGCYRRPDGQDCEEESRENAAQGERCVHETRSAERRISRKSSAASRFPGPRSPRSSGPTSRRTAYRTRPTSA